MSTVRISPKHKSEPTLLLGSGVVGLTWAAKKSPGDKVIRHISGGGGKTLRGGKSPGMLFSGCKPPRGESLCTSHLLLMQMLKI